MHANPDENAGAFVDALKQAADGEGFDICRITHPHAIPQAPNVCVAFWTMAIMVTWTGWRAIRSDAHIRRNCGRKCAR